MREKKQILLKCWAGVVQDVTHKDVLLYWLQHFKSNVLVEMEDPVPYYILFQKENNFRITPLSTKKLKWLGKCFNGVMENV